MDKSLTEILKDYLLKELENGELNFDPPIRARITPHAQDLNITKCYMNGDKIFISCAQGEVECNKEFYGTIVNK
jgi:hypothetical protein